MSTEAGSEALPLLPLRERYLLVIQIPVQRDATGRRFVEALWHKDLMLHLDYIENFSLACPCFEGPAPAGWVEVVDPRIHFVDLPSRRKLTLMLPRTIARLWRAIGQADIVHSGVGDWLPISIGNMTALFARLRGKYLLVIVESSTWRIARGARASWLARTRASLSEAMNRWCIGRADLAIFTQAEYKASLMRRRPERGHVIHASWIDEANLLSAETAKSDWTTKGTGTSAPLRVLFAGRLTAAKGVDVMLEAIDGAQTEGLAVHLDILGEGPLLDRCRAAAAAARRSTRVTLLNVIPYGATFFERLRHYHAVLVPSLSDEQPRIVYDAYSQAVPVLASNTPGLRDCVVDGQTGMLFAPNDARSLLDCLRQALRAGPLLEEMGRAGLQQARRMTHRSMHRQRWVLLQAEMRRRARGIADAHLGATQPPAAGGDR